MTLARFHRSLNKVYIPLDEEEELEVVRTAGLVDGWDGWGGRVDRGWVGGVVCPSSLGR